MRSSQPPVEDFQYCVLCDAVVLFEEIRPVDHPADDPVGEWICVDCGHALLIGAPLQTLDQTA